MQEPPTCSHLCSVKFSTMINSSCTSEIEFKVEITVCVAQAHFERVGFTEDTSESHMNFVMSAVEPTVCTSSHVGSTYANTNSSIIV
jgi:hypothetical protein